jgi:hypothetical protein
MMFVFPDDASWNEAEQSVEFSVELGEFRGKVFAARPVFQILTGSRPSPEDCVAIFHLNRTEFERITESKIRNRELDEDANIRISGRDLSRHRG